MNKKILVLITLSITVLLLAINLHGALAHTTSRQTTSPLFTHRINQAANPTETSQTAQQSHPLFPQKKQLSFLQPIQNILTPLTDHQLIMLSNQIHSYLSNHYPEKTLPASEIHLILIQLKEDPAQAEYHIKHEEPNPYFSMFLLSLCMPGPRCLIGIYILIILILLYLKNQSDTPDNTTALPQLHLNRLTDI